MAYEKYNSTLADFQKEKLDKKKYQNCLKISALPVL